MGRCAALCGLELLLLSLIAAFKLDDFLPKFVFLDPLFIQLRLRLGDLGVELNQTEVPIRRLALGGGKPCLLLFVASCGMVLLCGTYANLLPGVIYAQPAPGQLGVRGATGELCYREPCIGALDAIYVGRTLGEIYIRPDFVHVVLCDLVFSASCF